MIVTCRREKQNLMLLGQALTRRNTEGQVGSHIGLSFQYIVQLDSCMCQRLDETFGLIIADTVCWSNLENNTESPSIIILIPDDLTFPEYDNFLGNGPHLRLDLGLL